MGILCWKRVFSADVMEPSYGGCSWHPSKKILQQSTYKSVHNLQHRNSHLPAQTQQRGGGGFYQSIRPTQMGLSLNIDMSSTAFIEPLPVIDFVCELLNRDVTRSPLSDPDHVKIKKALRSIRVEVTHRGNMCRKYRISGLTSQATWELTCFFVRRNYIPDYN